MTFTCHDKELDYTNKSSKSLSVERIEEGLRQIYKFRTDMKFDI